MEKFIYIGNVEEGYIASYIKKHGKTVGGFYNNKGAWCVIVNSAVSNLHHSLPHEVLTTELKWLAYKLELHLATLPKEDSEDEISQLSPELKTVMMAHKHPEKFIEPKLIEKVIYKLNNNVMHELGLHWAGDLSHWIPYVTFRHCIEERFVNSLLEKYKIDVKSIHLRKGVVKEILFNKPKEDVEIQKERIYEFLEELESIGIDYREKQQSNDFPVEFELDDIKITPKS